jgi:hypothetical protein
MSVELLENVRRAVSEPRLARNLRGQVAAALRCLPKDDQKRLACDFAEHAMVSVCGREAPELPVYLGGIEVVRSFLEGGSTIRQVDDARAAGFQLGNSTNGGTPSTHASFWDVQYLLIRCCCQRELEAARLVIKYKYQPDAMAVAQAACQVVARHAGGPEWGADDPSRRDAARKRGRRAADEEAKWQIASILEFVEAASGSNRKAT